MGTRWARDGIHLSGMPGLSAPVPCPAAVDLVGDRLKVGGGGAVPDPAQVVDLQAGRDGTGEHEVCELVDAPGPPGEPHAAVSVPVKGSLPQQAPAGGDGEPGQDTAPGGRADGRGQGVQ